MCKFKFCFFEPQERSLPPLIEDAPVMPRAKPAELVKMSVSTLVVSEGIAFISANALFGVFMSVASGYPSMTRTLAQEFARYAMPGVAIPITIISALKQVNFKKTDELYRIITGTMNGLGLSAFTIPMAMECVTRIVQIVKQESRETPVYIGDAEAIAIISACIFVGGLQAIQTYYKQKNELPDASDPSRLNRFMTHKSLLILFSALNSASGLHAGVFSLMKLLKLDLNGTTEYNTRWAVTGAGFISGSIFHQSSVYDALLNVVKLSALGVTFTETFYLSPAAAQVFGNVVEEQTILWSAVIPAITTTILLLQLAGIGPDRIYEIITSIITRTMECTREAFSRALNSSTGEETSSDIEEQTLLLDQPVIDQDHEEIQDRDQPTNVPINF